jgi:hypothetical protein
MCLLGSGFPWYRNISLSSLGLSGPRMHSSWPLIPWRNRWHVPLKEREQLIQQCHVISKARISNMCLPVLMLCVLWLLEPEDTGIIVLQNIVNYLMTQHHIQEDLNHQQHNCKKLRSCYFELDCEVSVI